MGDLSRGCIWQCVQPNTVQPNPTMIKGALRYQHKTHKRGTTRDVLPLWITLKHQGQGSHPEGVDTFTVHQQHLTSWGTTIQPMIPAELYN